MVKLSILLPTYNGSAYLEEQIESILAQTDGDFELLMVDDGSTDGTPDILARAATRDGRLKVVPSEGNVGQDSRLWELFNLSGGAFTAIADQDDVWAADRNAMLFDALGGRDVVFGRSDLIDREGAGLGKTLLEALKVDYTGDAKLRALLQPMFSAHAMIVSRTRIHAGLFDRFVPFDWALALEAIFSGGIAYAPDAVVKHRMHGGNQVNSVDLKQKSRRVTVGDLRYAFLFQQADRLKLWANLDMLRRSKLLTADVRDRFALAARITFREWFTPWRSLHPLRRGKSLAGLECLRELAGSGEDAGFFYSKVESLAAPAVGLSVAREGIRRLARLRS